VGGEIVLDSCYILMSHFCSIVMTAQKSEKQSRQKNKNLLSVVRFNQLIICICLLEVLQLKLNIIIMANDI
jgi:hypothetical protein